MPDSYPVDQMIADMMSAFADAASYIVPAAIIVACVAFIVAWLMDSLDIAGKAFGRHR